jgi:hypothetical protein
MKEPNPKQVLQSARIVTLALVMSCFILIFVCWFTLQTATGPALGTELIVPLSVAALVMFIAAAIVKDKVIQAKTAQLGRARAFMVAHIVSLALLDAAGVIGFALSYVSRDLSWVLVFTGLAAALMLKNFPTAKDVGIEG